jgi:hypothetical protein
MSTVVRWWRDGCSEYRSLPPARKLVLNGGMVLAGAAVVLLAVFF